MYGTRSNGNQHGIVLTKPSVVNDMLDVVGYKSSNNLESIKITEPASGDGAFALEIIKRLYTSSIRFKFNFKKALNNLKFYEIDSDKIIDLKKNISDCLESLETNFSKKIIFEEDFLLAETNKCDIIIGNPPYVRHEKIPLELKEKYKKKFGTFKHRSDLYIPFFEKGLHLLENNGTLCFICSNRWLKNQYGESLRHLISIKYSVDVIIDLEKADAFQESVVAYPSIIKIDNCNNNLATKYYEVDSTTELTKVVNGQQTQQKELIISCSNWFVNNPMNGKSDTHLDLIEKQGFKIGIGVATGCDRVYIKDDFQHQIEKELLLPILMSKDLKNDTFFWHGQYIINPFTENGDLINLDDFPKTKKYFTQNENLLKERHIAKKNPEKWFKTIDKIKPELLKQAKIILPDISGNKRIFIDEGNYYPHHNLYFITGGSLIELKALAAILLSDFVRLQLSNIGNKMNGGYPRWQSQYLKKLRIPSIKSLPEYFLFDLTEAYDRFDLIKINSLVQPKNLEKYKITEGQLVMFDQKNQYENAEI